MLLDEQRAAIVHVTAANAREGTSTVAREIAEAVAASGWCKVALVDAHPAAGGDNAAGCGLLDTAERGEPLVMRAGMVGGGPVALGSFGPAGNLLARMDSVRGLYEQLRAAYTLTVVDCPPVLSGGGAAVLGAVADGTILVVEAERTHVATVTRARELLEQVGAPLLGVVLNKSRSRVPGLIRRFL